MNVKATIRDYWDKRSESYDRSPGHVCLPELWKSILNDVFEDMARILDVGTGTGFLASLLAELGHEVVGLDISKGMLNVARRKTKVDFILGDAESLPFKDESFDAVICRHLLWTLPNPGRAISEWVRVAREMVVIIDGKWMTNNFRSKLRRFLGRLLVGIYERRNPFEPIHYGRYLLPFYGGISADIVIEMLRSAGLKVKVLDLSWLRKRMGEKLPFAYRIAWTSDDYFMIVGFV